MGAKKFWKKVEKGFKKVADQIDNFIDDPKGAMKKAIDHAPEEFKKAGDNIVKEAEKGAITFMKAVEKADDQIRHEGNKIVDKVKNAICDECDANESCDYKEASLERQEFMSHEIKVDDVINTDGHEGL